MKRHLLKLTCIIFISSVFVSGCSTMKEFIGDKKQTNLNQEVLNEKVVVGKTTKENILSVLGEPDSISSKNGNETWVYLNENNNLLKKYKSSILAVSSYAGVNTSMASIAIDSSDTINEIDNEMRSNKIKKVTFNFNKKGVVNNWKVN